MKQPRAKKCRHCQQRFAPNNTLQVACSPSCALEIARTRRLATLVAPYRTKRGNVMHDKGWHMKTAQAAFNAFCRQRDIDDPCISCGRFHKGQWHAGHYRSVGAMRALRFNELNCHKQCSVCNNHKSGAIAEYRIGLIKKIGIELVEWLEGDHPLVKYTIDDYKQIAKYYREQTRRLKRDKEQNGVVESDF